VPGVINPPSQRAAAQRAAFPVALVSMPFGPPLMPSIQIGLLAAIAREAGFPAEPMHLALDFAARVGAPRYNAVASQGSELANWLFSVAAFGEDAPDQDGSRLHEVSLGIEGAGQDEHSLRHWLLKVRGDAEQYLDDLVEQIDWSSYAAIGFTITYQQKTASFALAKKIKQRWPEIHIVFGGAHFDAPMGAAWMDAIPWIDFGVNGEADVAFPELLAALAEGRDPLAIPGVLGRDGRGQVVIGPAPQPPEDLDWLPVPDFDDFFERAERLALVRPGRVRDVQIPFEAARGCWWGEKNHCTFCGISDELLRYRRKSAAVVERELVEQVHRYRSFSFLNTDLILDLGHLDELLGGFAERGSDLSFWWEVKANLSRHQVRKLREGGLHTVQPGIESLDSESLRLMHKGTRSIINVNLLRWCAYYGLDVKWNRIYGFPHETAEGIEAEAELMRSLHHLGPPGNIGGISLDRFSPLFEDPEQYQRSGLRPAAMYDAVYPPYVDLERAAFAFDATLEHTLPDAAYEPLIAAVQTWSAAFVSRPRPRLTASYAPGVLHLDDRRWRGSWRAQVFEGTAAEAYMACFDQPRSLRQIVEALPGENGDRPAPDAVADALDDFVSQRLVMRDGNLFLALALPATPYR
jgi:ribosomal peptide maturation radical SAM protein 1